MSALLLAFSVPAERFGLALPLGLALLAVASFAAFPGPRERAIPSRSSDHRFSATSISPS